MDKLLPFQKTHVENIVGSLMLNSRVLDASDTGTGKTFCILAACKIADLVPFVLCPKSVISNWYKVAEYMDVELFGISNYELMQNQNYWSSDKKKIKANFLQVMELDYDTDSDSGEETNKTMFKFKKDFNAKSEHKQFQDKIKNKIKEREKEKEKNKDLIGSDDSDDSSDDKDDSDDKKPTKKKIKYDYIWDETKLPANIIFIFDEAHKCKNHKTNNGRMLYKLAGISSIRIALLSATVADKAGFFKLPGYVLGLYKSMGEARTWLNRVSKESDDEFRMEAVHRIIYPDYASRMKIIDLHEQFPSNHIIAEKLETENAAEIEAQYKLIQQALEIIRKKEETATNPLTIILYARQQIELLKIPLMVKLTKELIAEGKHVAIFVNFTDTLLSLGTQLDTSCFIYGEQKIEVRDSNIKAFMENKEKIVICNIRAGGVGISLHDIDGRYPRVALISPTWSAQDLVQVLGRVHRANCKSPVEQKILFCKGTYEDNIAKIIQEKVKNIGFLNDGSMESYQMENLIDPNEQIIISETKSVEQIEFESNFDRLNNLYLKKNKLEEDIKKINEEIEILNKTILNSVS